MGWGGGGGIGVGVGGQGRCGRVGGEQPTRSTRCPEKEQYD